MKFLIATNALKGTLSAIEASKLIASAIGEILPDSELLVQPVADGGDGTCELLIDSLKLEKVPLWSLDAIGRPIFGYFGWDSHSKTAYLDVSTFSGIGVLADYQKEPKTASTFGTGLAIRKAIDFGAKEIVLGLGGSATIDLGAGILSALGFLFLDEKGREVTLFSPDLSSKTRHIQQPLKPLNVKFTCLCDVKNTFFGERGAIPVFGPQKGLKAEELELFELSMTAFFDLMVKKSKIKSEDQPGFGAAGGIAMGLDLFFSTKLEYGARYFFDQVGLENKLLGVDWIITAEGRYDDQSADGKGCFELLRLARNTGKKIALITSGDEGETSVFDLVMKLPDLNFSNHDVKQKARENLHGLVVSSLIKGVFD
jgi:glycerate 2-kinase